MQKASDLTKLRDRDEAALGAAFSLMFKLARSEGQVLAKLATQDYSSKEELHATVNRDGPPITLKTISVTICMLRKKLTPYSIKIATAHGLGYGLRKDSRDKIRRLLIEHDAGLIPTHPRAQDDLKGALSEPPHLLARPD